MPAYDYRCPHCGQEEMRFNIRIQVADRQRCSRCFQPTTRQVPKVAFTLKGKTAGSKPRVSR